MKLLHWNIHMWLDKKDKPNYESVKKLIYTMNPDIVTLTEVEDIYDKCLIDKLSKELSYISVFCPCFDFIYENERYSFGNAILSKLPFTKVEHKIITPVNFLYDGHEQTEPRSLTWVQLYNIDEIKIGITHLPRKKTEIREFAINNLKKFIPKNEKFILAGDFNTNRNELLNHFDNSKIYPLIGTPTYPCNHPLEEIDHIITKNISITECKVLENFSSDHFPILVEFNLI